MKYLDSYLEYLENLKLLNFKKRERKSHCEKLKLMGKELLNNLDKDISLVKTDDLRKVFSFMEDIDASIIISEYEIINKFSKFFNNLRLMNQPQVVNAKKSLDKIKNILRNFLIAVDKTIGDITFFDEEKINNQINFIKRIKKKEIVSTIEIEKFFNVLMECDNKDIDKNVIIMNVFMYVNNLYSLELNKEKKDNETKIIEDSSVEKLSLEEIDKIEYYYSIIQKILKLDDNYTFENIYSLKLIFENEDNESLKYYQNIIKNKIGISLTLDIINLLDEFNDIYGVEDNIRNLSDNEYLIRIREIIKELDKIFIRNDNKEENDDNVLENPRSLVIFLENERSNRCYVEDDYEDVSKVNRDVARIAVKKIIENHYSDNVSPSKEGVVKKIAGLRLLHSNSGRYARSYYVDLSVSSSVKEFLQERYNTSRVYLYIGFINIGNHEVGYGDDLINRCQIDSNRKRIDYLNKLFSKDSITQEDKNEIIKLIDGSLDVTNKLNNFEGMKR